MKYAMILNIKIRLLATWGLLFLALACIAGGSTSPAYIAAERLYRADIDSMRANLGKEAGFSAELTVTNKNVQGFLPSINAVIHRKGECMYYKVLHLEYLFGKNYSVIVNHKAHSIAYAGKDAKGSSIKPYLPDLDSVLILYDSVVYQGEIRGTRKYVIYRSKALISKSEVYYDPSVKFFSKLVYKYNHDILGEDATIEVDYKNIGFNPVFSENEFKETRFIVKKGNTWVPVPDLQGYSISEGKTDFGEY